MAWPPVLSLHVWWCLTDSVCPWLCAPGVVHLARHCRSAAPGWRSACARARVRVSRLCRRRGGRAVLQLGKRASPQSHASLSHGSWLFQSHERVAPQCCDQHCRDDATPPRSSCQDRRCWCCGARTLVKISSAPPLAPEVRREAPAAAVQVMNALYSIRSTSIHASDRLTMPSLLAPILR